MIVGLRLPSLVAAGCAMAVATAFADPGEPLAAESQRADASDPNYTAEAVGPVARHSARAQLRLSGYTAEADAALAAPGTPDDDAPANDRASPWTAELAYTARAEPLAALRDARDGFSAVATERATAVRAQRFTAIAADVIAAATPEQNQARVPTPTQGEGREVPQSSEATAKGSLLALAGLGNGPFAATAVAREIRPPGSSFVARFGRQSAQGGALLVRYDGVRASRLLGSLARLDVAGGFPVDPAMAGPAALNRSFLGVSLELAPFREDLTGQLFAIQENMQGVEPRNAVGGTLGFASEGGLGLAAADYDLGSRELGTATLVARTRLGLRTSATAFVDVRASSAPSRYMAIRGKPIESLQQLLEALSRPEVRPPSLARGPQKRSLTLGASHRLSPQLALAADVTLESVDTSQRQDSASELACSVVATWTDPAVPESYTSAALRISDRAGSRSYFGSLGGYYSVSDELHIGPDLSLEYRDAGFLTGGWTYRPSLRLEYLDTSLRLDLQLGFELGQPASGLDGPAYFYTLSWQGDF